MIRPLLPIFLSTVAAMAGRLPAVPPNWDGVCDLSRSDFESLDHGTVIARVLPPADPREVAIFGAARVPITRKQFLRWYRNIENFKLSPLIVEARRFSAAPAVSDMALFQLSRREVDDLAKCRPGDCSFKLTAAEISRLKSAGAVSTLEMRRVLTDSASAYLESGNDSLTPFADNPVLLDRREEFSSLLESSACVTDRFPSIAAALRQPPDRVRTEDDFIYWAVERYGFGLKPLLTVFHARIHQPHPSALVVSARQIRATHYYDGSLAFTLVLDAPGGGVYLVYQNRSRIDLLQGVFKGWKRDMVQRRAPGAIRKQMSTLRERLIEFAAGAGTETPQ